MSAPPGPATAAPPEPWFTQTGEFWRLMAYAVGLGVFGALVSLAFIKLTAVGGKWYSVSNPGWGGGHWWWVAVTAAAGLAVGLLRLWTRLPENVPGLIPEIVEEHVQWRLVPKVVAVSLVSLIGGASLGPEKALGAMGGGAASWLSQRRGLSKEDQQVNTLAGFGGAYAGLFSSPLIIVMFLIELVVPTGQRGVKTMTGAIVAASVSFGIYFGIAGAFFLGVYRVPPFQYHGWQLLAGVGFGLLAAVLVAVLVLLFKVVAGLLGRLKMHHVAKSTLSGVVFGLVGVALPLTMFTGSAQLRTVLHHPGVTLGLGILIALVIGKMLTFAASVNGGFIGGPIFPSLFIGGTAGVAVHQLIPAVPLGLAFACLFAAVPGSIVSAPFSCVLLTVFVTQVGALQTAPVLIAVITAYLAIEAVKYLLIMRKAAKERAAKEQAATAAA